MNILSTPQPEIKELAKYLQSHPDQAFETAIGYQQKWLILLAEYQKLQAEYLALKAQRRSPSVFPVSTFLLSFIASIRITKLSFRRRRKP